MREEKGAVAENGSKKASGEDAAFDFGVRVMVQNRMTAAGYYGQVLGAADAHTYNSVEAAGTASDRPTSAYRRPWAKATGSSAPLRQPAPSCSGNCLSSQTAPTLITAFPIRDASPLWQGNRVLIRNKQNSANPQILERLGTSKTTSGSGRSRDLTDSCSPRS